MQGDRLLHRRFVAIALLSIVALSVDPNPRGPLSIAADLWLAGHDAEARRWEHSAANDLRDLGIDPASLALSFDLSPVDDSGSLALVRTGLDRLARDDRSKTLFCALHEARGGDRESARKLLESRPDDVRIPRWSQLLTAVSPAEPP